MGFVKVTRVVFLSKKFGGSFLRAFALETYALKGFPELVRLVKWVIHGRSMTTLDLSKMIYLPCLKRRFFFGLTRFDQVWFDGFWLWPVCRVPVAEAMWRGRRDQ